MALKPENIHLKKRNPRGIPDDYTYFHPTDTIADITASGYFSGYSFTNDNPRFTGFDLPDTEAVAIQVQCADGPYEVQLVGGVASVVGGGRALTAGNISTLSNGGVFYLKNDVILDSFSTITLSNPVTVIGDKSSYIRANASGSLFKLASSDVKFIDVNFSSDSNANIFNLNDIPSDISGFTIENSLVSGVENLAFCNDALTSSYFLIDPVFKSIHASNVITSALRLSGIKMKNVLVDNVNVDGSGRHGVYVGYINNSGLENTMDDISLVKIKNCTMKNINPSGDPGSEGSYGIYASGEFVTIHDCSIEDHYSLDNTAYSNMEPIYTKARYYRVHDISIKNCTANQGGVAIKGINSNADIASEFCEVYNVTFKNESKSAPFNSSSGVWCQSDYVRLRNITLIGLSNRPIILFSSGLDASFAECKSNTFNDCSADIVYNINGKYEIVDIGDGDKFVNSSRTGALNYANVSTNAVLGRFDFHQPFIDSASDASLSSINYIRIEGAGDVAKLVLFNPSPSYGDNYISHGGTVDIGEIQASGGNFESITNFLEVNTNGVSAAYITNCSGVMERRGTVNIISSVTDGSQIQSNTVTVPGAKAGDTVRWGLDLPASVYILGVSITADDSVRFYIRNNSGSTQNLSSVSGFVAVDKVGGAVDSTI